MDPQPGALHRLKDYPNSDTDDSSLDGIFSFSDTHVALQMLRDTFIHTNKVTIKPFFLRSQLYGIVKDRTQADRELEVLRRNQRLRIFKLNTGKDDDAVMFYDDYLCQIDHAVEKIIQKHRNEFFKNFKTKVINCCLDCDINHQKLCALLSSDGREMTEKDISLLINAGLLTRKLIDQTSYWFAIPNIGSVLNGISQGRRELMSLLNRRRYKDMMLGPLKKKHLRSSPLSVEFHLSDLVGSGRLEIVDTPAGPVVRVSRD